ncbi:MAG: GcrA family cell cycle regulator, partial [Deltaproteobacteria bacterium]
MSWSDERIELLKKMWNEGQSASAIAKELGGVTRNAVIGKVHRLGLSNRVAPGQAPAAPVAPVKAVKEKAPAVEAPIAVEPAVEAPRAVIVQERQLPIPPRRPIIIAGQPLPPQPSANEISPEALASVREVEKTAPRISLMELTERTCKWPIGDPATENFWFCGLPSQQGKP